MSTLPPKDLVVFQQIAEPAKLREQVIEKLLFNVKTYSGCQDRTEFILRLLFEFTGKCEFSNTHTSFLRRSCSS
jgi:hypothetical protein